MSRGGLFRLRPDRHDRSGNSHLLQHRTFRFHHVLLPRPFVQRRGRFGLFEYVLLIYTGADANTNAKCDTNCYCNCHTHSHSKSDSNTNGNSHCNAKPDRNTDCYCNAYSEAYPNTEGSCYAAASAESATKTVVLPRPR